MRKCKLLVMIALIILSGCGSGEEKDDAPKMQVLEKWQVGDAFNVALLVSDTSEFNSRAAFIAVSEYCGEKCNMAYFYGTQEAYDLHALSRSTFTNPDVDYGGDTQKMLKAQEKWRAEGNHWKKIQDNLIATVNFGDFQPYPYK